jgi:hypothetical protein
VPSGRDRHDVGVWRGFDLIFERNKLNQIYIGIFAEGKKLTGVAINRKNIADRMPCCAWSLTLFATLE